METAGSCCERVVRTSSKARAGAPAWICWGRAAPHSIRTWDADGIGLLLERAHSLGLTVTVGFWLGHERHGFDYANREQVAAQYERVREGILRFRDHPAVLAWTLGNEMEGYEAGGNPRVWAAVDSVAALAHALDPNHPTMTVTADIGGKRVESVHRLCPSIDIMGINSYGGAPSIPERYRKAGGTSPYMVTEYGPPGTWEIGRNDWGDLAGGYDLSGARKLSFWVRGASGGERVKFGFGLIPDDKKHFDPATAERGVVLKPEWTRVEIAVGGRSLRRIKSGFWWTLRGQGAPVTFWLDDVRYE